MIVIVDENPTLNQAVADIMHDVGLGAQFWEILNASGRRHQMAQSSQQGLD